MFIFLSDSETGSESIDDGFADAFKIQPSKRAFVADMGEVVFVQYTAITFKLPSSSTVLQFTVDYSMDGLQWNDYIEDKQVKVRRNPQSRIKMV